MDPFFFSVYLPMQFAKEMSSKVFLNVIFKVIAQSYNLFVGLLVHSFRNIKFLRKIHRRQHECINVIVHEL